jgi:hypothetical protein
VRVVARDCIRKEAAGEALIASSPYFGTAVVCLCPG